MSSLKQKKKLKTSINTKLTIPLIINSSYNKQQPKNLRLIKLVPDAINQQDQRYSQTYQTANIIFSRRNFQNSPDASRKKSSLRMKSLQIKTNRRSYQNQNSINLVSKDRDYRYFNQRELGNRNILKYKNNQRKRKMIKISATQNNKNIFDQEDIQNNLNSNIIKNNQQREVISNKKISQFFRRTNKFKLIRRKDIIRKLKAVGWAAIFMQILDIHSFQKARRRKLDMQYRIIGLNRSIQDLISYYNTIFKAQLDFYVNIIHVYTEKGSQMQQYQQYLYTFIEQLSIKFQYSSIPKNLMDIFKLISFNRGYIPSGLFFQFQLERINISESYGCMINIDEDISIMILGIFLIIQILCANIIYKPWHGIHTTKELSESKYQSYNKVVKDAGSIFYFMFLQQFQKIPKTLTSNKQIYQNLNIQPQNRILVEPKLFWTEEQAKGEWKSTEQELIDKQSKNFYQKLKQLDDERMFQIKDRMLTGLKKIYKKLLLHKLRQFNK